MTRQSHDNQGITWQTITRNQDTNPQRDNPDIMEAGKYFRLFSVHFEFSWNIDKSVLNTVLDTKNKQKTKICIALTVLVF